MYAGKAKAIDLPSTGHLHILKNGYVYWHMGNGWNSKKKQPDDGRVAIGKIDPDNEKMFFPNSKYWDLFPTGTDDKGDTVLPTHLQKPGRVSSLLNYGCYAAMKAAADKTGCLQALKNVFPGDWKEIFAVALHAIDAQDSTAQNFENWSFHNYCGLEKPISDSEISRLFKRIGQDPEDIADFLYQFREKYFQSVAGAGQIALAFDSTNQNTYSKHNPLAEYGHPKVDEKAPDISTAMFVDEATSIPIYYEVFYGSLLDKAETPVTLEKAKDLGFSKLLIDVDCGYCSEECARAMSADGGQFIAMCPDSISIVDEMMAEYAGQLKDNEEYYIYIENAYGLVKNDVKVLGGTYDAYLFYDPVRGADEVETIHEKVKILTELAETKKRYTDKLRDRFAPWLTITKLEKKDPVTGKNFTVKENAAKVQECINRAGYFVVISNTRFDPARTLHIARTRDCNEKVFCRMKSHFDLAKTYTHEPGTYLGKMFVAFIGLVIVQSYRWYVRNRLSAVSSVTTATTIGELDKYQIWRKRDGTWMPYYAMTKKQKDLFSDLLLTEKTLVESIRNIKLLV